MSKLSEEEIHNQPQTQENNNEALEATEVNEEINTNTKDGDAISDVFGVLLNQG